MSAFMAIHSSLTNGIKPLSKETPVLEHCVHDLTIYQFDYSIMNASIYIYIEIDMHCDMQLRVSEMLSPHGNSISTEAILALHFSKALWLVHACISTAVVQQ